MGVQASKPQPKSHHNHNHTYLHDHYHCICNSMLPLWILPGGSATQKNPVRDFKYFKQFMARFQDFRALEIDVRNNSIT